MTNFDPNENEIFFDFRFNENFQKLFFEKLTNFRFWFQIFQKIALKGHSENVGYIMLCLKHDTFNLCFVAYNFAYLCPYSCCPNALCSVTKTKLTKAFKL